MNNKLPSTYDSVVRVKIETPISHDDLRAFIDALSNIGIEIEIAFATKSHVIILPDKRTKNQLRKSEELV